MLAEVHNMKRGDRESRVLQTINNMHADLKRYREVELTTSIPDPKFKCGQSVLQRWASWMKSAKETPSTYNKKLPPAWFSAEVCSFKEYGTIRYAGQMCTANLYNVY